MYTQYGYARKHLKCNQKYPCPQFTHTTHTHTTHTYIRTQKIWNAHTRHATTNNIWERHKRMFIRTHGTPKYTHIKCTYTYPKNGYAHTHTHTHTDIMQSQNIPEYIYIYIHTQIHCHSDTQSPINKKATNKRY